MRQSLDDINGTRPAPGADRRVRDLPDEILIDPQMLRAVAVRRLRKWKFLVPLLFIGMLAIQLVLMPQKYEAVTSISVQQPKDLLSPLGALAGASNTNAKYLGLLESRDLAGKVEAKYHLQRYYGIATHEKTIEMLIDNVRPEDNTAIGLLLVHVTLPGAPRFGPDPHGMRRRVPKLVAEVANTYAHVLNSYFAHNDNDRESELLRAAEAERLEARALYDSAEQDLRAYVHNMGRLPAMDTPTSTGDSGATASASGDSGAGGSAAAGLTSLIAQQIETRADIEQLEAARVAEDAGVSKMLGKPGDIPLDDPLLRTAREQVKAAEQAYDALKNGQQLADENPQVKIAKHRVTVATAELERQKQAINNKLTTPRINVETRIEGLKARLATIRASIASLEHRLPHRRDRAFELGVKEREMEIALVRLKAAETKSVELRLTAVSGNSRISVVDTAIPAQTGQPGLLRASLISLLVTLAPLLLSILRDYLQTSGRSSGVAMQYTAIPALPSHDPGLDGMVNGATASAKLGEAHDEATPQ